MEYTSPTGLVPEPLAAFGHLFLGDGQQRFALELSQHIFTPLDDKVGYPLLNDQSYAAVLMGANSLVHNGTDAYVQTQPFAWYGFTGVDGQAVALDETFDGPLFETSRHVTREPFVREARFAFTLMA